MKRLPALLAAVLAIACVLAPAASPGAEQRAAGQSYLVLATGNTIPPGLEKAILASGGTVTGTIPEIGAVVASSESPSFAKKASAIKGVRSVMTDAEVQWTVSPVDQASVPVRQMSIGNAESFYPYQWGPAAIHAPEAWDLGARGTGVRVAIVDGGISSGHLEIRDNLDVAASKSFVPGVPYNFDTGQFWHATHVAGIVAAGANAIGTIGIAPGATLVGVKVLHDGSGPFSRINAGIIYAASQAQIINLSLGASLPRSGFMSSSGIWVSAREVSELIVSLQRALDYAHQMGATIIASAGNDAMDCDHNGNLFIIPAQLAHVIAVSATGPVGFASGGTNYDTPASYTNFGQSLIELAAPGGDYRLYPNPYWYLDMVFSSSFADADYSYYSWASGTSMSVPHVAGVAALVQEAAGGTLEPAQVEAILRNSADDLGKSGNDDYYGKGRVNAYRAVLAARDKMSLAKGSAPVTGTATGPAKTGLLDNYPNPFNPATTIRFVVGSLQGSAPSRVRLAVYDLLGREVALLVDGDFTPGEYTAHFNAAGLASGVYLYRLEAGRLSQSKRMLLVQ